MAQLAQHPATPRWRTHGAIRSGVALALIAGAAACSDATAPADDPPELPAAETMTFDFDFFEGGASSAPAAAAPARQSGSGQHWAAGALAVGAANISVVVHLAVPVATWRAAAAQTPVLDDGVWHWSYSVTSGGQNFSSELRGFRQGDDRVFEMEINDFLWYRGRAPIGGTSGSWEFFDPDAPATVVGRIDWSHPAADRRVLTFSAVAGPNVGDELEYETHGADRFVTFHDESEGATSEVHWNALTREGHVIGPNYNGGAKACWDGALQNTPCD